MNVKAIIMNKQILLAMGMIVFVGAVVASGTGAFFSSQASATGNTFAAGTMELLLAENEGGSSPDSVKDAVWDFDGMAPGGTPEVESVWLRNSGSIPGESLGIAIANGWTNPSNIAQQMRITEMTVDGSNILKGGAGATIPEYELDYNCNIEVNFGNNDYSTITNAIAGANSGDVICVGDGNYSSGWEGSNVITVDEEVIIASVNGAGATQTIPFDVGTDNVTITGFEITGPNEISGVQATNVSGLTVAHNHIHNIATTNSSGSAQGIYLHGDAANMSNIDFTHNRIESIGNSTALRSAKGIYIGDTLGTGTISDVNIANNIVENVTGNTSVTYSAGGRGGYGIMTNHGGNVQNLVVENNSIKNLNGWWSTAIGLEGRTQNAVVRLNEIGALGSVSDGDTGVNFESNISAASVPVNQNNFDSSINGVIINPNFTSFTGTIDATNNWWGDFNPSDNISENNGTIDTSNFAGGPFAGFVNGNDANGNGFADLHDLRNDPIVDVSTTLETYTGSEDEEFVMGVQLDGPTTGNSFQGLALDDVTIEFTLNQI